VKTTDRISEVKDAVHKELGIPPYQQRMIFGRELEDSQTVGGVGMKEGSRVILMFRLRG
jgi:hypothetical protein